MEKIFAHPKPPAISIFCVITEWNIGHLVEFVDYFKDMPIKHIGFMHTNFTSEKTADIHNQQFGALYPATASNMEEIQIDNMDLDVLWEEIKQLKQDLQSERKYIFQTKRHEKWLNQRIEASRIELRHKEYERKMVNKTLKYQRRVMRNLSSDSLK